MKKTIYWNNSLRLPSSEFLTKPLITLRQHLIEKEKEKGSEDLMYGYLGCPAAAKTLKNIFVVRAGLDLKISFKENSVNINTKKIKEGDNRQKFLSEFFFVRSFKDKVVTLQIDTLLYSEDSVHAMQMQPFLENTEFAKNTGSVVAEYDISKWLRPIQPTFYCYKDEIVINEGDVLFYIFIPAEENVKIVEFEKNQYIDNIVGSTTSLKFFKPKQTMKHIYDFFVSRSLHKKVLKHIKSNLIR